MNHKHIISRSYRRLSVSRHKVKQADGVVTKCSSRIAKSGSRAYSFYIGKDQFTIFTSEEISPVTDGDSVRFDYEIRRLTSGYRREYFSVIPESLIISAPSELSIAVEGSIYILSNPSMPKILKVGYTTGAVTKRAAELSSVTSVPTGFRVEWSLPIFGDPRAVEQRAHAHLAKSRHGKEFFKVSLDEAKAACIQSFAELYPEMASKMDDAFASRAIIEVQRREDLRRMAMQREMEREKQLEQQKFEVSREGKWRREGACQVLLCDFQSEPNRKYPSFFSKLFGVKFEDYIELKVIVSQRNDTIIWDIVIGGRIQEKLIWKSLAFTTQQECMEYLSMALRDAIVENRRATISVPNKFIENPPELPECYSDTSCYLTINSLDGLIIRPAPEQISRPRYLGR